VAADLALVADGPFYAPGWPAAEVGVRGLCYAEIHVRTLEHDLHSGLFGGVAPNAHNVLVQILSALTGGRGRIRIPGVYRSVRRPSKAERHTWEALPFDEEAFTLKGAGATSLVGDPRKSVHERLWALPTLDIHGISGGFTGDGVKTVIPAEARAKVSLRLVPDQKAKEIYAALERYVHSLAPNYATVTVRPLILTDPVVVDTGHPSFTLLDQSFKAVFGRGLSLVRSGGSLPILGELGRSGAAVLMAGIGLADDGLHAPNERFSIDQFLKGIQVFADFFQRLGAEPEGGGT